MAAQPCSNKTSRRSWASVEARHRRLPHIDGAATVAVGHDVADTRDNPFPPPRRQQSSLHQCAMPRRRREASDQRAPGHASRARPEPNTPARVSWQGRRLHDTPRKPRTAAARCPRHPPREAPKHRRKTQHRVRPQKRPSKATRPDTPKIGHRPDSGPQTRSQNAAHFRRQNSKQNGLPQLLGDIFSDAFWMADTGLTNGPRYPAQPR